MKKVIAKVELVWWQRWNNI